MEQVQNPFVAYLNRYTTASPDHEAAFDEFIASALPPAAGNLRLSTKIERFLRNLFSQTHPPSVILTGNAGDGKTYLCRQIVQAFSPDHSPNWEQLIDHPIERNQVRLFIIKDLSELNEEKGQNILKRLATTLNNPQNHDRYLIAANEGRLRHLLTNLPEQTLLSRMINDQLQSDTLTADQPLIVVNLNRVSTSTFVPDTLRWMTDPRHWSDCQRCPVRDRCPIRYNAIQLTDAHQIERVQRLYQLLEATGEHVTIRDMLIHLAYTMTGGQQCATIQPKAERSGDLSQFAYYENVFGRSDDEGFRRKSHLTQLLARLQIGQYSRFEIDDFILSGGKTESERQEHRRLFDATVDLNHKNFDQERRAYLEGGDNERAKNALNWLPHCRRKIFFAGSDQQFYHLLPFRFFETYQQVFNRKSEEEIVRIFVRGLNRAFSRLYHNEEGYLYVTSQYIYSVNQPHPLILLKIPIDNVRLIPKQIADDHIDVDRYSLYLDIAPPPRLPADPVTWHVGLLQFEYVMRLAHGGHTSVLANECELDIRRLREDLIRKFAASVNHQNTIEFFVPARKRYHIRRLRVNEQGKITDE